MKRRFLLGFMLLLVLVVGLCGGFLGGYFEAGGELSYEIKGIFSPSSSLVTLWFDDIWESQFLNAYPLMEEHDFQGVVSVITKIVGEEKRMDYSQLNVLRKEGWEIASHSVTHSRLSELSQEKIIWEFKNSKETLESYGFRVDMFAFPYGEDNPELLFLVKDYYKGSRDSERGFNSLPVKDPYNLRVQDLTSTTSLEEVKNWVEEAIKKNEWLILRFHQIDKNGEIYSFRPENFQELVKYLAERKVQVVIPREILN